MSGPNRIRNENRRAYLRAGMALLAAWASPLPGLASGHKVPAIDLRTTLGDVVLADGSPWRATYLDFWASWCAPCQLSFPWMNGMQSRFGPAGLRVVAVNLDRHEAEAKRFLEKTPAFFEVAMDPAAELARRMDVKTMPTSMLIAADRSVVFVHRGFRLEDRANLERRIGAALGLP